VRRAGGLAAAALLLVARAASAERPVFPPFPPPYKYGTVVLDNFSTAAGMKPVPFEHWRHRLLYTCRLCHVDVGFAMEAGATRISADTNRSGLHCGACHNGKTKHVGEAIFASCSSAVADRGSPACARCHGRRVEPGPYEAFARTEPRDPSGLVDWEEAEGLLFTKPVDHVEGVSLRPDRLGIDRNFSISVGGTWLGEVAFSHQKHARWCGCESCHPEVFPTTSRGAIAYRMKDIVAGEYCGACHNKVAFPIASCLRCHEKPPR
jgi:c(7)-type cytochrome triheme protein